jgi:hypothetical protein
MHSGMRPSSELLQNHFRDKAEAGEFILKTGDDFELAPRLSKQEKEAMKETHQRYIEITSVTRDGLIVAPSEGLFEDLPNRKGFVVKTNDVLFAKNNSSRGTSVLIPQWFDGGLATTGFISVRPRDFDEAMILWSIFRSELWRKQVYYLSITASQPEVRDDIFVKEMIIPWPATTIQKSQIVESACRVLRARENERIASSENTETVQDLFVGGGDVQQSVG